MKGEPLPTFDRPKGDSLGDRMKGYEDAYRIYLPKRMPVIIRVDGRAFHTVTRHLQKPFDPAFTGLMEDTAGYLMQNIQNAVISYVQSDEISILMNNWRRIETESWFDNNLQKMVSIAASLASAYFSKHYNESFNINWWANMHVYQFDARAFVLPKEEVCNYFIWRQQDATRNSIQGLAQSTFSHKELHGLNCKELQDKLFLERDMNWNDLATSLKRGVCVNSEGVVDDEIPIFTQNREYIEMFLKEETDDRPKNTSPRGNDEISSEHE